jgi:hypothetical protein
MKNHLSPVGLGLSTALLLGLTACAGLFGGGRRPTNVELDIISFGSLNGELSPCG